HPFGHEAKWTDPFRIHEVIRTSVDPTTALSVGLKVDSEALPPAVVQGIQNGSVDARASGRAAVAPERTALFHGTVAHAGEFVARSCARCGAAVAGPVGGPRCGGG